MSEMQHPPSTLPKLRLDFEEPPAQRACKRLLQERQQREQSQAALLTSISWIAAYLFGGIVGIAVALAVLGRATAHGDSGSPGGLLLGIGFFGVIGLASGLLFVGLIQAVVYRHLRLSEENNNEAHIEVS